MSPTTVEDDLRAAFRAAADRVEPTRALLPAASTGRPSPRRRWLVPAVAAAVVVAVGAPIVALGIAKATAGPDIAAASQVRLDGNRATVAGLGFPVPVGWSAVVVGHDTTSVTVCVAASPSADCVGVTMRIAVPDARGRITPVRDSLTIHPNCPNAAAPGTGLFAEILDLAPIDDRPAIHEGISCGPPGPQEATWFVTDGSLAVSAPPGRASAGAAAIVAGIDFSAYRHAFGPQIAFVSPPDGPGAATSAPITPTG
jgi:hypothetical protein